MIKILYVHKALEVRAVYLIFKVFMLDNRVIHCFDIPLTGFPAFGRNGDYSVISHDIVMFDILKPFFNNVLSGGENRIKIRQVVFEISPNKHTDALEDFLL